MKYILEVKWPEHTPADTLHKSLEAILRTNTGLECTVTPEAPTPEATCTQCSARINLLSIRHSTGEKFCDSFCETMHEGEVLRAQQQSNQKKVG